MQHPSYLTSVVPTLIFVTVWFAIGLTVFGPLHWLFRAEKQPFWRSDMKTDLGYWFLAPLPYGYIAFVARSYAVDHAHLDRIAASVTSSLDAMPILLQVGIILLLTDVVQYWGHRLFHRSPLWRFHCIHHAPKQVDWLTSVRFHPVNFILYSTLINLLVSLVGFSPKAFLILVPFNMLSSLLVHANLNWTFGPFRYVLASPVFHRWHHTYPDQGGNKNFAPNFPFLDLAFGTFHMPKGQMPCVFGIVDRQVPNNLFGQLCHPFRRLTHTPPLRRAEQPLGGETAAKQFVGHDHQAAQIALGMVGQGGDHLRDHQGRRPGFDQQMPQAALENIGRGAFHRQSDADAAVERQELVRAQTLDEPSVAGKDDGQQDVCLGQGDQIVVL